MRVAIVMRQGGCGRGIGEGSYSNATGRLWARHEGAWLKEYDCTNDKTGRLWAWLK